MADHGSIPGVSGPIHLTAEPVAEAGHWCWKAQAGDVAFRFYGKRDPSTPVDASTAVDSWTTECGLETATLEQRHSCNVIEARPGNCGPGDALLTGRAGLALRIVTADCVPVLLMSEDRIAAVHAGWRGIAADILAATLAAWRPTTRVGAVLGPAIGPCCYEVGEEVAEAVVAASGNREIVGAGRGARPHLDLHGAVRSQLERLDVGFLGRVASCTRCSDELWSYRRDGPRAGRNLSFVWRQRS